MRSADAGDDTDVITATMSPRLTMSITTTTTVLRALLVLLLCDVTLPAQGDVNVNVTCPTSVCACRAELVGGRTRRVIDCASRGLDAVPDLMAFTGLNFDEVRVNDNLIQSVARGAFRGADVTRIDLSDNPRLEGFSNFAFKVRRFALLLFVHQNKRVSGMSWR